MCYFQGIFLVDFHGKFFFWGHELGLDYLDLTIFCPNLSIFLQIRYVRRSSLYYPTCSFLIRVKLALNNNHYFEHLWTPPEPKFLLQICLNWTSNPRILKISLFWSLNTTFPMISMKNLRKWQKKLLFLATLTIVCKTHSWKKRIFLNTLKSLICAHLYPETIQWVWCSFVQ